MSLIQVTIFLIYLLKWGIAGQPSNPHFFSNDHVDSPRHLFFFFWKPCWKVCLNWLPRTCCHPPAVVSQAVGGPRLESQWCQQAQSLSVSEVRMSQHPQSVLGWSNPRCWYRRWALLTAHTGKSEVVGQCHSSLHSAKAGKCLVAHKNAQAGVAPVWVTSHWHLHPLHEATQAEIPPPLMHKITLH